MLTQQTQTMITNAQRVLSIAFASLESQKLMVTVAPATVFQKHLPTPERVEALIRQFQNNGDGQSRCIKHK